MSNRNVKLDTYTYLIFDDRSPNGEYAVEASVWNLRLGAYIGELTTWHRFFGKPDALRFARAMRRYHRAYGRFPNFERLVARLKLPV